MSGGITENIAAVQTSDVASVRHMQKAAIPVEAQLFADLQTFKIIRTSPELTWRKPNVTSALIVFIHTTLLSAGLRAFQ
jgi:hypothetical protein